MHVRRSKWTPYSVIQNLIDLECVSREQTWTLYSAILDLIGLLAGFVNKKWFFLNAMQNRKYVFYPHPPIRSKHCPQCLNVERERE